MNKVKKIILIVISLFVFALPGNAFSADESVLFTSVPPDALVVLDLSGSMDWNPAGGSYTWGVSSCAPDTTACSCGGTGANQGYCNSSTGSCNTNCSRVNIAKRALFDMLDDTGDGTIQSTGTNTDDNSLNIRMGYMSFCDGNDTAGDYNSGNIRLRRSIGTIYSRIFCDDANTCTMSSITDSGSCTARIDNTRANSGTPLSSSLIEAKSYLDDHKAADTAKACRDKFVILISDGADTYVCSGGGGEDVNDMYKRRRETVARAKALGDAGYKVFVIGFGGNMPLAMRNTLNWAAYYGGTDNPIETNSGSVTGYNITKCPPCPAPPATCPPCVTDLFPAGVASCQTDSPVPTTIINNIAGKSGGVGDTVANANDPATANLSGYAFIAADATQLTAALKRAVDIIRSARYSFTHASIATGRITGDDNHLYEASFTPVDDEPFWLGRLKKYSIQADGNIGSQVWDAGDVLAGAAASGRNIKTCLSGTTLTDFSTAIARNNFAVATDTRRNEIVGYIRGEAAYNQDNWKLGDIWHSSPIVISSPSPYFDDIRDSNSAFAAFRTANQRTSAIGNRIVMAGANDGQFHVFRTSSGAEAFSFIPPNMLPKLQLIDHITHPTSKPHQFFVDGPISAADVWLGSGSGTSKSSSDWKTMVVFGLGRGVGPNSQYLWSASSSCTPTSSTSPYGYSSTYHATNFPYYCGYYAFDFTNTLSPQYRWRLNPSGSDALYFGDPWSKMAIGRVKIGGNEKWVGFIGGGGYEYSCATTPSDAGTYRKGFFVVDLSNGSILWRYTAANNSSMKSIPAQPTIIDTDLDGFIDTAYVGDLGGNMWRFKFCEETNNYKCSGPPPYPLSCTSCSTSDWSGGLLYNAGGTGRPIYTKATTALDESRNRWVYWGTGDKQCPAATGVSENFFALKDVDRTTTHSSIVSSNGWRISLSSNEKVLADNTVFDCALYFTTFIPVSGANPCEQGGAGYLYGIHYTKGIGVLGRGNISACNVTTAATSRIDLGTGIPSAPIVSLKPEGKGADLYITTSGGGGIDSRTFKEPRESPGGGGTGGGGEKSSIIYWRDRRVQ